MDSHAPPFSGRPPSGCGTGRWLLSYDETEIKLGRGAALASVIPYASAACEVTGYVILMHFTLTYFVSRARRQAGDLARVSDPGVDAPSASTTIEDDDFVVASLEHKSHITMT